MHPRTIEYAVLLLGLFLLSLHCFGPGSLSYAGSSSFGFVVFSIVSLSICSFAFVAERKCGKFFRTILTDHISNIGSGQMDRVVVQFASSLRDPDRSGLWICLLLFLTPPYTGVINFTLWPLIVGIVAEPFSWGQKKVFRTVLLLSCFVSQLFGTLFWAEVVQSYFVGFLVAFLCFLGTYALLVLLVTMAPKSFTVGEAGLLSQYIHLLCVKLFGSERTDAHYDQNYWIQNEILFTIKASVIATFAFLSLIVLCRRCRRFPVFTYICLIISLVGAGVWLSQRIDGNLVIFGLRYLVEGGKGRWCLLLFWALCFSSSVLVVCLAHDCNTKITTGQRKFFHLTLGLVAVSGLQLDPELTLFASVIIGCLFVILEVVRILKLPLFGRSLAGSLGRFVDNQDQGPLVLTPMYLLFSAFLPLWLSPVTSVSGVGLKHYAGIVAVGVGDSAASVCGSLFGRHFWSREWCGKKTVEGTVAGLIAQLVGFGIAIHLTRTDFVFWGSEALWLLCVSSLIALVETFTAQIDNLVLPLLAYVLLC